MKSNQEPYKEITSHKSFTNMQKGILNFLDTTEKLHTIAESKDEFIYQEKYVIFVDILGWSNLVVNSVSDIPKQHRINKVLEFLKNDIKHPFKSIGEEANQDSDAKVSIFSDCMFISFSNGGLKSLFSILQSLSLTALEIGRAHV